MLIENLIAALELTRPLVALDIEGTGTNTEEDLIVELSLARFQPGNPKPWRKTRRINPGIPIPPAATEVHGITDADVADCPPFAQVARSVLSLLEAADYVGYNATRYDLPLLEAELRRCGLVFDWHGARVVDPFQIFIAREPRDLEAAVRFYCGREHEDAHGAEPDVDATLDVLGGQLAMYDDLPRDLDGLDAASRRPEWLDRLGKIIDNGEGVAVFNFGKHEGKPVVSVERGYCKWLLDQDFPSDTKALVRELLGIEVTA